MSDQDPQGVDARGDAEDHEKAVAAAGSLAAAVRRFAAVADGTEYMRASRLRGPWGDVYAALRVAEEAFDLAQWPAPAPLGPGAQLHRHKSFLPQVARFIWASEPPRIRVTILGTCEVCTSTDVEFDTRRFAVPSDAVRWARSWAITGVELDPAIPGPHKAQIDALWQVTSAAPQRPDEADEPPATLTPSDVAFLIFGMGHAWGYAERFGADLGRIRTVLSGVQNG